MPDTGRNGAESRAWNHRSPQVPWSMACWGQEIMQESTFALECTGPRKKLAQDSGAPEVAGLCRLPALRPLSLLSFSASSWGTQTSSWASTPSDPGLVKPGFSTSALLIFWPGSFFIVKGCFVTWEAEIRRIVLQGQLRQMVLETPSPK
jgi:hypothetical protein